MAVWVGALACWLALVGCSVDAPPEEAPEDGAGRKPGKGDDPPNLLLVIADDLGAEKLASYDLQKRGPRTPTLDGLAQDGMSFDHAWAYPVCSPTRAMLLTGKYGFRTGIGLAVQPQKDTVSLSHDETTLPELLAAAPTPYTSFAVGKWHLGTRTDDEPHDPMNHGFAHHAGSLANLKASHAHDGQPQTYFDWEKSTDGELARTTKYATTDTTDEALARIADSPEPWFGWVAYNAPHAPYDPPPSHLYDGEPPKGDRQTYDAMVEALDAELGRLLNGMDPAVRERTVVVFVGDNGTPGEATRPPVDPKRAKHSVYEPGVHVPLIFAGPGISAGRSDAIVSLADLFATFGQLAGLPKSHAKLRDATDSVSLMSCLRGRDCAPHDTVYTERFEPNGGGPYTLHDRAIRDARYKLIRTKSGEELYAIGGGWLEGEDLLTGTLTAEQRAAKEKLAAAMTALSGP